MLPCDGSRYWQVLSFQILTKPERCKLVSSLSSVSESMPSLQVFTPNLKSFSGEVARKDRSISLLKILLSLEVCNEFHTRRSLCL